MIFITLKTMLLVFAPQILMTLGHISDYVSDISPECVRSIEHIVFTMLLN